MATQGQDGPVPRSDRGGTMLYLMLIYQDDARMKAATPEEQAAIAKGYGELDAFLAQSGALRGTATWPAGITTGGDGSAAAGERGGEGSWRAAPVPGHIGFILGRASPLPPPGVAVSVRGHSDTRRRPQSVSASLP